jgi:hypothetical protein
MPSGNHGNQPGEDHPHAVLTERQVRAILASRENAAAPVDAALVRFSC